MLWSAVLGCSLVGPGSPGTSTTSDTTSSVPLPTTVLTETSTPGAPEVVLFTRTEGYRHGSIGPAVEALTAEATQRGWGLVHTEEPDDLVAAMPEADVLVFLLTTGDVLDDTHQQAMEAYVQGGGGFVGVHSATDTEYSWIWYGGLVGAYFSGHPAPQQAEVVVDDASHSSTAHLDARWSRFDEWYAFDRNPREQVNVLLSLDEATYDPGVFDMAGDHPIAWSHTWDGGRSFYTAGGHTSESYADGAFLTHLAEGISWAAGPR